MSTYGVGGSAGRPIRVAIAALAAGLLLLAGCGDDTPGDQPEPSPTSPTPSESTTPSPSLPPTVPTTPPSGAPSVPPISPPSTDRPGEITISGELVSGVEPNCLLLSTGSGDYLLFGEPVADLRAGDSATLRGRVRSDMMSTCQQGTPFEVTEVLR
ncbi:MAG TPA: hypothetical protein VIL37_02295 [Natronosporangium sp.]